MLFWWSDGVGWWTEQAYNRTGTASATATPLTNLPATPTVSSALMDSTSSAFGSGFMALFRSPLLSGPVMSPVNGGKVAANVTSAINPRLLETTAGLAGLPTHGPDGPLGIAALITSSLYHLFPIFLSLLTN